jgi:hypothetical protein
VKNPVAENLIRSKSGFEDSYQQIVDEQKMRTAQFCLILNQ